MRSHRILPFHTLFHCPSLSPPAGLEPCLGPLRQLRRQAMLLPREEMLPSAWPITSRCTLHPCRPACIAYLNALQEPHRTVRAHLPVSFPSVIDYHRPCSDSFPHAKNGEWGACKPFRREAERVTSMPEKKARVPCKRVCPMPHERSVRYIVSMS